MSEQIARSTAPGRTGGATASPATRRTSGKAAARAWAQARTPGWTSRPTTRTGQPRARAHTTRAAGMSAAPVPRSRTVKGSGPWWPSKNGATWASSVWVGPIRLRRAMSARVPASSSGA